MKTALIVVVVLLSLHLSLGSELKDGTGCELPKGSKIPVLIEHIGDDEIRVGLSKDLVQSKVELQLRKNGLNSVTADLHSPYYCYVNIGVVGNAFTISVDFDRRVTYEVNGLKFTRIASVYHKEGAGDGANGKYIINALLDSIDMLSNEIQKSFVDVPEKQAAK